MAVAGRHQYDRLRTATLPAVSGPGCRRPWWSLAARPGTRPGGTARGRQGDGRRRRPSPCREPPRTTHPDRVPRAERPPPSRIPGPSASRPRAGQDEIALGVGRPSWKLAVDREAGAASESGQAGPGSARAPFSHSPGSRRHVRHAIPALSRDPLRPGLLQGHPSGRLPVRGQDPLPPRVGARALRVLPSPPAFRQDLLGVAAGVLLRPRPGRRFRVALRRRRRRPAADRAPEPLRGPALQLLDIRGRAGHPGGTVRGILPHGAAQRAGAQRGPAIPANVSNRGSCHRDFAVFSAV